MKTKSVLIELESLEEIEIDVTYDDENIYAPADLADRIKRYALDFMIPRLIKEVENQLMDMELDGTIEEWGGEDGTLS